MAFDKNNTSLFMKVVIVIFAVILVATLCLPFFSGCSTSAGTQTSDETTEDESADSSSSAASTDTKSKYATVINSLLEKHEADPDNLTYVANLGNRYKEMALTIQNAAGDETDADATEAFETAISYYDEYLEAAADDSSILQSSVDAVTLSRSVCLFYTQDKEQTAADLASYLGEHDYAMGWYYLGSFYQELGDNDSAKEAYTKVSELDPDNESGAGVYAQYALLVIQSQEEAAAEEESADSETSTDEATETGAESTEDSTESSESAETSETAETATESSESSTASTSTSTSTAATDASASSSSADSSASEK